MDLEPGTMDSVRAGPYGMLNILAETPENTGLDWSVIDVQTNQAILGYEKRTELFADLGRIDWILHPSIKIKVHLWKMSLNFIKMTDNKLGFRKKLIWRK